MVRRRPVAEMKIHWGVTESEMAQRNIVFLENDDFVSQIIEGN